MRTECFVSADCRPKYRVGPGQLLPEAQVEQPNARLFDVEEVTHGVVQTSPYVAARLGVTDDRVVMTEQVTSLGDVPLYVVVGYSPLCVDFGRFSAKVLALDKLDDIPDVATAFELLYEKPYGGYRSVAEALRCDGPTAKHLRIDEGSTILSRETTLFDTDGVVWNLSWSRYRPDLTRISKKKSYLVRKE